MIETTEEVNLDTLLEKLKSKVVNGYSSVRQAFLVFDEVSDCPSSLLHYRIGIILVPGFSLVKFDSYMSFSALGFLLQFLSNCSSLQKRSGKISRKDFKNVIDGFCFRMTESQFAKLMTILDPGNRGSVSYLNFFKLFEDSESSVSLSSEKKHFYLNSANNYDWIYQL